jgi:leucyl aminopeptidase
MDFAVTHERLDQRPTGCIVVGVYEGGMLSRAAGQVDAAASHAIGEVLSRGDFDGELGAVLLLAGMPGRARAAGGSGRRSGVR